MKKTFATCLIALLVTVSAYAQQKEPGVYPSDVMAIGGLGVSGIGLLARHDYELSTGHSKKLVKTHTELLRQESRKLSPIEIKSISKNFKHGDQVSFLYDTPHGKNENFTMKLSHKNKSSKVVEDLIHGLQKNGYSFRVIGRTNGSRLLKIVNKFSPAKLFFAGIGVVSAGTIIANHSDGSNKKAQARFNNSGRRVVEKSSGASQNVPARKTANVSRQ